MHCRAAAPQQQRAGFMDSPCRTTVSRPCADGGAHAMRLLEETGWPGIVACSGRPHRDGGGRGCLVWRFQAGAAAGSDRLPAPVVPAALPNARPLRSLSHELGLDTLSTTHAALPTCLRRQPAEQNQTARLPSQSLAQNACCARWLSPARRARLQHARKRETPRRKKSRSWPAPLRRSSLSSSLPSLSTSSRTCHHHRQAFETKQLYPPDGLSPVSRTARVAAFCPRRPAAGSRPPPSSLLSAIAYTCDAYTGAVLEEEEGGGVACRLPAHAAACFAFRNASPSPLAVRHAVNPPAQRRLSARCHSGPPTTRTLETSLGLITIACTLLPDCVQKLPVLAGPGPPKVLLSAPPFAPPITTALSIHPVTTSVPVLAAPAAPEMFG